MTLDGTGAKLLGYSGRGPLLAWLRRVAVGTSLNVLRGRRARVNVQDTISTILETDVPIDVHNPEFRYLEASCGQEFRIAFQQSLTQLSARERNVLRLRYIDGLTVDEVAGFYRIHRATVLRWSDQINRQLLSETRARLKTKLSLPVAELDSLLNAGRAQLDVSLGALLRAAHVDATSGSNENPEP